MPAEALPTSATHTVSIGLLSELTGPYTRLGKDCRQGYDLARALSAPEDKVGSRTIKFTYGDNQGEAKAGLSEFRRLVDIEGAQVVFTTRTPVAMALNPQSKQRGIPLFGAVAHPLFVEQNPYAFRTWPNAKVEGQQLALMAHALGKKRIAFIAAEDDYYLSVMRSFQEQFTKDGGVVVSQDTLLPTEQDLSSVVTKLKRLDFDSIFCGLSPMQTAAGAKRVREQGITQSLIGTFVVGLSDVIASAGGALEGAYFSESNLDHDKFSAESVKRFGEEKFSSVGYCCYIGLGMVLQTLAQNPEAVDSKSITIALNQTKRVDLLDASYEVKDHEVLSGFAWKEIRGGKAIKLPQQPAM